jgi:hypothetical protein
VRALEPGSGMPGSPPAAQNRIGYRPGSAPP